MTTARTTTAQPIAASISIPDAISHSTAFARRKPLLLLKIVRQTGPRSVRLPQTARRRSGKRHRPPRKVRKARPRRLRPRLFVCGEKAARQKGRPDRTGVRRRRKETGRLAGSAQRSAKPLRLCGNGNGLTAPILSSSPAVPPPRSAAGEPPEACRPRPPSCTAVRILQGLAFSASPPNPASLQPSLIRPGISPPRVSFAAAPGFPCRTRHFPSRPTILCRMPRFSQRRSTAALCVPLAAHEISLCARPRFAVPDAFANRRSIVDCRTRRFLLRTPWPTVPAMPDDAPPSPNARQLCPAPLFCRPSLHSEVSLN